tara:strand:+ start:39 stop:650 length:612 start_codon:yes stop_codon:yes gene_type:complete
MIKRGKKGTRALMSNSIKKIVTSKHSALELSIGTIVIIVLAMSMLILGLVLIRTIFTGAKYNVETMNDKVRDEISELFTEEKKTVIYLANQKADINPGEDWGVAFAIKNLRKGVADAQNFRYIVEASDSNIKKKCGINEATANSWIATGGEDNIDIPPGDTYHGVVRFRVPEGSPLCIIRFNLDVKVEGETYAPSDFFDIDTT